MSASAFTGFAPRTVLRFNENATHEVVELLPAQIGSFAYAPVLSGADAALFSAEIVDGAVVVRFLDAPDFEAPDDWGANNRYDVTVSLDFGSAGTVEGTAVAQLIIRITDLYEPLPIFVANGTGDNLSVTYNNLTGIGSYLYQPRPAENGTGVVLSVGALSPDPTLGTPSLVMSGVDAALFTMDAAGNVTFLVAPDFEAPGDANGDNVYELTFTATAGVSHTATARILVRNVNEIPPEITSPLGTTAPEIATGTPYGGGLLAYAPAANLGDANSASWAITGADAARFSMDQHYNIFFRVAPDFEAPNDADGDGVYSVTLTVTTDGGLSDSQDITVTLTDVNERPVNTSAATISVAENSTGTVYTGVASDEDGDTLAWSLTGEDATLFTVDAATGAVRFVTPADFERPSDNEEDNYYHFSIVASDGALADTQEVRLRVTNAQDAPVITSDATASVAENFTGLIYVATATDDDRDAITFSLAGADAALFTFAGGQLRFQTGADFEIPGDADGDGIYAVTVRASDGGRTTSKALAISITNVAEAPVVTSPASVTFAENGTGIAYQAAAFAETGEPVTWLLGGTDRALFGIDSLTGAVSFVTAPDFETPADAGGDNVYDIKVFAGTPSGMVGEAAVSIAVTDVRDVIIYGTSGADNILGTGGIDTIIGLDGADILNGRGGSDTLSGGEENDLLNGGRGADSMAGGEGDDTYLVEDAGDVVFELAGEGIDTVRTSITLALAEGSEIENLVLAGIAEIDGSGTSAENRVDGNIAANTLSGLGGADTLAGGAGNDTLLGGEGDDSLIGGAGDDRLEGGDGSDQMRGNSGADTFLGGAGDDIYFYEASEDLVVEVAGEGTDVVRASISYVQAEGDEIEQVLLLGNAALSVTGNGADNNIEGNEGANVLLGFGGADRIVGNGGADSIEGGAGDDSLFGSAGADTLRGGAGVDRLQGGVGNDIFVYGGAGEGGDQLSLFEIGLDRIALSASGFFGGAVAEGADLEALGRFQINDTGLAVGALAQFIYESDVGRLWFDANGDAAGGRAAMVVLTGAPGLTIADLVVIA